MTSYEIGSGGDVPKSDEPQGAYVQQDLAIKVITAFRRALDVPSTVGLDDLPRWLGTNGAATHIVRIMGWQMACDRQTMRELENSLSEQGWQCGLRGWEPGVGDE